MNHILKLVALILLLSTTSCYAQKLVQSISDSKKLELHKDKFIGKPLSVLLSQIGPKIKSAIGNPDDISQNRTKTIMFLFIDKKEWLLRDRKNEKPTHISVSLAPAKTKKKPVIGSDPWTKEQELEYGDMIVLKVWVNGKN